MIPPGSDPAVPLRAFLYADPAAHSRSPAMHRAAFAFAGLNGTYEARRVGAADLGAALSDLRAPGVLGANLSLPHKEAALAHLDALTPAARAISAVNTVIHREGALLGDNTDAPGLVQALRDAGMAGGGPVLVLGAGGAARAAVYAAQTLLGREVWVLNRTRARAEALALAFGSTRVAPNPQDVPWESIQLVINASSAGLNAPDESPLPESDVHRLPAGALVYDMVYAPAETRLMREARAAGRRAENGLGMLAHQARLAFLAWTGREVPAPVFLGALGAGAP